MANTRRKTYVKRERTEAERAAAADRAERLRAWMAEQTLNDRPLSQGALIRLSGLAESLVTGFLSRSGQHGDVGALRGYNVVKLVRGMRVLDPTLTGESVARMLNVDDDHMERWIGAETRELPEDGEITLIPNGPAWLNNPDREPFEQLAARATPMDPLVSTAVRAAVDPRGQQVQGAWTEPLKEPLQGALSAPAGWRVSVSASGPAGTRLWLYQGRPWALPAAADPGLGWTPVGWIQGLSER